MIEGIKREWVDQYWPIVSPWIAKACARTGCTWTLEKVRKALDERTMQLWVVWTEGAPNLAILTEIYDTAAGPTCSMTIVAGSKLDQSWHALDTIKKWAREQGCVRVTCEGRKGWERLMQPRGWTVASIQMECRL